MPSIISFGDPDGELSVSEDFDILLTRLSNGLTDPPVIPTPASSGVTVLGFINATLIDGTQIAVQASTVAYVRPAPRTP